MKTSVAACLVGLAGMLCAEPLQNVALGKVCTFTRKPNYNLTRDPDDARQLTDGKYAKNGTGCLWTRRESVGWVGFAQSLRIKPPTVTVAVWNTSRRAFFPFTPSRCRQASAMKPRPSP